MYCVEKMIEPGLEKSCYKLIKKKTGKKVDLLVGFFANLSIGASTDISQPLNIVCGLSEDTLWFIEQNSVQAIPLKELKPKFTEPQTGAMLSIFEFELISGHQTLKVQSTDANGDCGFGLWLSMLAKRNGYSWWN